VQDTLLVGMVHGAGDDCHQPSRCSRVAVIFLEPFRQVPSFDQLHAEKAATAFLADPVDRHDVGMVEVGDRLGLVAEPSRVVSARTGSVADYLEGDQAVQAALSSPEYDAHPAPRDHALQFIVAEVQSFVSRR